MSNNQVRAYEFICLLTLSEEIGKQRPVNIVQNSNFLATKCMPTIVTINCFWK